MLPDRIELSTSPLPMECSTTELRQHVLGQESAAKGAYQAGRYLPQAPLLCKLASSAKAIKSGRYREQNACFGSKRPTFRGIGSDIPTQLASCPTRRIRSISIFARSDRAGLLSCLIPRACYRRSLVWTPMADENDESTKQYSRQARASRDDRLKSALRENLKRRKLQARGRSQGDAAHDSAGIVPERSKD